MANLNVLRVGGESKMTYNGQLQMQYGAKRSIADCIGLGAVFFK
jgi:hypothetical protein